MYQFAFIGMGNMASAMLQGYLKSADPDTVIFSRKDSEKGFKFAQETGIHYAACNADCVKDAKYVILAVKPQFYDDVLTEIKDYLSEEQIIISLAPSYSIEKLKTLLGEKIRIIRAMPNTPAKVGAGMTGIAWSKDTYEASEKEDMLLFFSSFGRVESVSENLMDAVTAASGSSPAFIYMMIEALADGVVRYGMPRKQAYTFVAQAVLGSAQMVLETGEHPGVLKDQVCSPGGTTIAAVAALEEDGFRNCLIHAASEVCERCRNM